MTDNTKTYKEQLGLTRPKEWLEDAANAAQRFLDEREETISNMSFDVLLDQNPEALLLITVPGMARAYKFLSSAFFCFGYYKGLQDGEDREKVRRLVDG